MLSVFSMQDTVSKEDSSVEDTEKKKCQKSSYVILHSVWFVLVSLFQQCCSLQKSFKACVCVCLLRVLTNWNVQESCGLSQCSLSGLYSWVEL